MAKSTYDELSGRDRGPGGQLVVCVCLCLCLCGATWLCATIVRRWTDDHSLTMAGMVNGTCTLSGHVGGEVGEIMAVSLIT